MAGKDFPEQSPTYEKDHTYNVVYLDNDGEQQEEYFTPTKNTTKVGIIAGMKDQVKDFFKLVSVTESKKITESKKLTESVKGLMQIIWEDSSFDNMTEEEIANLQRLDDEIGEVEDSKDYGRIPEVIDRVGTEIGLCQEEKQELKNYYARIYSDEAVAESEDYFEIIVNDGDKSGVVSLSKEDGKWHEAVISGDLDKSKFHKSYQGYLTKGDILQWFKQDFGEASLNESKLQEYSNDLSSVVTEYTITYVDMENEDEYFDNKEDADERFEEIKQEGNLDKVYQYYKKNWEYNEETQDYDEGDVEVYYTQGDLIEEDIVEREVEEKPVVDESGYLHITFTDGSNPYLKYTKTRKELDKELNKWKKNYTIETIKEDGNNLYVKATSNEPKSDLFDFSDYEEELEEK